MGLEASYRFATPETRAGPQDLSLSAARREGRAAQSGLRRRIFTYIPMARGFVYLVAVVDWFTRVCSPSCVDHDGGRLLHRGAGGGYRQTWQTGNFQLRPGQSIHRRGVHRRLARERIAISMDGKGSWRDNVFVERLWKSVKYEEVYLKAYDTVGTSLVAGPLSRLLQSTAPALKPRPTHPGRGLLRTDAHRGGGMKVSAPA